MWSASLAAGQLTVRTAHCLLEMWRLCMYVPKPMAVVLDITQLQLGAIAMHGMYKSYLVSYYCYCYYYLQPFV